MLDKALNLALTSQRFRVNPTNQPIRFGAQQPVDAATTGLDVGQGNRWDNAVAENVFEMITTEVIW